MQPFFVSRKVRCMSVDFEVKKWCVLVCLSLLCMVFPAKVRAQLRLGPKAGIQLGRTVYDNEAYRQDYSSGFRPGMQVGAVLNYKVNHLYSLHTELFFSQKGKRSKSKADDMEYTFHKALYDYLDLPFLLRLSKHKNLGQYKLEFYLNVGPSLNYWLGGSGTVENSEYIALTGSARNRYTVVFEEPAKGDFQKTYIEDANRMQMSLDFGGGVIFDLGGGKAIMVDLRNSLGLGKTYMGKEDSGKYGIYSYTDNFESVNHVFGLSVAYLMDIDVRAYLHKGRFRR